MTTEDIIIEVNKQTNDKYGFIFRDAVLTGNVCTLVILYKDGTILSKNDRIIVEKYIVSNMPNGFDYQVKFVKNFVSEENIIPKIKEFFSNMPSINYKVPLIEKKDDAFVINLEIEDKSYNYFVNKKGNDKLVDYLSNCFYAKFIVNLKTYKIRDFFEEIDEGLVFDEKEENIKERIIDVTHVESFVGEIVFDNPKYIKDVCKREGFDVCICGTAKFVEEMTYERKKQTKKPHGENEEDGQVGIYYKFILEDFTEKIKCVCFANRKNSEALKTLANGDTLVVVGDISKSKYGDSYSMKIKRMSRCNLPEKFEEVIDYKSENSSYLFVRPEKIKITAQVDLFSSLDEHINEFLLNHDIVAFDFETTGLDVNAGDKIIEIGAVKIHKGKIKEKFMSFVDPQMHIPDESTKIHGIVDKDVAGAPKYYQMIPDFYKFTRNCILVGHNISFDYGFLNKFARDCKYKFDNDMLDTYHIAMKAIKGVKNYKLGTICEKLGVVLDNAHRAVFDALATAEVLIKMADMCDLNEHINKI